MLPQRNGQSHVPYRVRYGRTTVGNTLRVFRVNKLTHTTNYNGKRIAPKRNGQSHVPYRVRYGRTTVGNTLRVFCVNNLTHTITYNGKRIAPNRNGQEPRSLRFPTREAPGIWELASGIFIMPTQFRNLPLAISNLPFIIGTKCPFTPNSSLHTPYLIVNEASGIWNLHFALRIPHFALNLPLAISHLQFCERSELHNADRRSRHSSLLTPNSSLICVRSLRRLHCFT